MRKLYLVTGATGHVGSMLVSELVRQHAEIRVLVLPCHSCHFPEGVQICEGDITKPDEIEFMNSLVK